MRGIYMFYCRFGLARSSVQKDGEVGERGIEGVATSRKHEKAVRNLKARVRFFPPLSILNFSLHVEHCLPLFR